MMSTYKDVLYNLNEIDEYSMIEMPCFLTRCATGVNMLGGESIFTKLSNGNNQDVNELKIQCNLSKNNEIKNQISSNAITMNSSCCGLVLNIKKLNQCNSMENPGQYKVDVIGKINKIVKFETSTAFQLNHGLDCALDLNEDAHKVMNASFKQQNIGEVLMKHKKGLDNALPYINMQNKINSSIQDVDIPNPSRSSPDTASTSDSSSSSSSSESEDEANFSDDSIAYLIPRHHAMKHTNDTLVDDEVLYSIDSISYTDMLNNGTCVKYGFDKLPKQPKYKLDDLPTANAYNLLEILKEYIDKKASIKVLTYILIKHYFEYCKPLVNRLQLVEMCMDKQSPAVQLLTNYSGHYNTWCIRGVSSAICYSFTSGPYKGCCCLYGYNPYDPKYNTTIQSSVSNAHSNLWLFQILSMRIHNNVFNKMMNELVKYWNNFIKQLKEFNVDNQSSFNAPLASNNSSFGKAIAIDMISLLNDDACSYQVIMKVYNDELSIVRTDPVHDVNGDIMLIKSVDIYVSSCIKITPQYGIQLCEFFTSSDGDALQCRVDTSNNQTDTYLQQIVTTVNQMKKRETLYMSNNNSSNLENRYDTNIGTSSGLLCATGWFSVQQIDIIKHEINMWIEKKIHHMMYVCIDEQISFMNGVFNDSFNSNIHSDLKSLQQRWINSIPKINFKHQNNKIKRKRKWNPNANPMSNKKFSSDRMLNRNVMSKEYSDLEASEYVNDIGVGLDMSGQVDDSYNSTATNDQVGNNGNSIYEPVGHSIGTNYIAKPTSSYESIIAEGVSSNTRGFELDLFDVAVNASDEESSEESSEDDY